MKSLLQWRKPKQITVEEYLAKLTSKGLNKDGTPVLDPTPIAPPIGYKKHPSMVEIVRDMVRGEKLRMEALAAGHESFEESEDFDIPDDPVQMRSEWENDHDPSLEELARAGQEELVRKGSLVDPPTAPGATPSPKKGGGEEAEAAPGERSKKEGE